MHLVWDQYSRYKVGSHYDFPMGLREYIQESGQAARDGASAKSVILYSQSDFIQFNTFIIATNY